MVSAKRLVCGTAILAALVSCTAAKPFNGPRGLPLLDWHVEFLRYNNSDSEGQPFNDPPAHAISGDGDCFAWHDGMAHLSYSYAYAGHLPSWWTDKFHLPDGPADYGECTILSYSDDHCAQQVSYLNHAQAPEELMWCHPGFGGASVQSIRIKCED